MLSFTVSSMAAASLGLGLSNHAPCSSTRASISSITKRSEDSILLVLTSSSSGATRMRKGGYLAIGSPHTQYSHIVDKGHTGIVKSLGKWCIKLSSHLKARGYLARLAGTKYTVSLPTRFTVTLGIVDLRISGGTGDPTSLPTLRDRRTAAGGAVSSVRTGCTELEAAGVGRIRNGAGLNSVETVGIDGEAGATCRADTGVIVLAAR
ncbi:hypothetical protein PPTG_24374 [Phytophthora nicotianae INRA-310]|uniref:Uncharacterized protein n=1 Tax=Phytophthora nicotianae (strain INRA-310) TaxID=761204 RepID=W2PIJ5_PHYN3|nr:hypothetical protein PPTG_24374 [Phytophthora nicotianae INRA-310]ETM99834.1 hypothetical protein PPTG_24374 [Phytophthora nicotianae INRA-310]